MSKPRQLAPGPAHSHRGGFTLLEVLLALLISSLIVAAVAGAIDFQLRAWESGRSEVEETQLARALLRRMADDLRSAVRYQPLDAESMLTPLMPTGLDAEALAAGGLSASALSALPSSMGSLDVAELGEAAADAQSNVDSLSQAIEPPLEPGVYGNQYELQVDVSRLPRVDQYDQMLALQTQLVAPEPVSDVKTVTYYVRQEALGPQLNTAAITTAGGSQPGGLVRRQLDRAVAAHAALEGDWTLLEARDEVLAPEVAALELRYFDGTEWVLEWDSSLRGGLPLAVEIAVAIDYRRDGDADENGWLSTFTGGLLGSVASAQSAENDHIYRLLVHLPAAEPTSLSDAALEESSEASTSADPSSGGTR